jgi:hypothetical protein
MYRAMYFLPVMTLLLGETARAQAGTPPSLLSTEQMAALMHTYVRGEWLASIPFAISGAATVTTGGLLIGSEPTPLNRGLGWPLLVVGVLQLGAGAVLGVRTPSHEAELSRLLDQHPQDFARAERAHVGRIVNLNQPLLLAFEGAIVAAGAVMGGVGAAQHSFTVEGVGIGLAAQGLLMFVLDWAVLDRARAYLSALEQFHP